MFNERVWVLTKKGGFYKNNSRSRHLKNYVLIINECIDFIKNGLQTKLYRLYRE